MGNERSFMQLCGVVGDLIILCPLGLRSWLRGKIELRHVVDFVAYKTMEA